MTDERAGALSVKDLAVLIPLFATSLAISWEVGRFEPFGGFLFFSLSEHLLAAMQALPVALFIAAGFAVLTIPLTNVRKIFQRVSTEPRAAKFVAAGVGIGVSIVAGWYFFDHLKPHFNYRDAFAQFGVTVALALMVLNIFWFRLPWSSPTMLSLIGGASIILAMLTGVSQSLAMLEIMKSGSSAHNIATIVSKNDTSKGYVLMMGERGLLIYLPDGDRFSFQKADEIQKIEWQR